MTLLITIFAAVTATALWYKKAPGDDIKLGTLALMYWGASLMWVVDAVYEYIELRDAFFRPEPVDMLNDAFLGFSVVAMGMVIWIVLLLIKDPKKVLRKQK
ncbi:MAG: hypothetical protein ACI39Q_05735 [Wujia sp.]